MNVKTYKILTVASIFGATLMTSCVGDENSPGLEYMPDMYRSPAVEAYVDYAEVRGIYDENASQLIEDKLSFVPPSGTIPYYGTGDDVWYMMPYRHGAPIGSDQTHGLYGVRQDSAGKANAALDLNPVAYSAEVAKEGEALYGMFCAHCHGEKGDGQGPVVTNSMDKFPPPPAYKKDLTPGTIFYVITYGQGVMGSHASQLNIEERWKVVYHVQKLAGVELGTEEPAADTTAAVVEEGALENVEGEHPVDVHNGGEQGHENGH